MKDMTISDIESNLIASAEDLGNYQDPKFDPLFQAIRSAIHAITEARADRDKFRSGICSMLIPDTVIACGEGGNYCSEICRLRASKDGLMHAAIESSRAQHDLINKLRLELDEIIRENQRLSLIAVAAKALVAQPMLQKGDRATWGDVAQSDQEGPRLLGALMRAVEAAGKP